MNIKPPDWLVRWLLKRAYRTPYALGHLITDGSLYMERYDLIPFNWTNTAARIHITWRSDQEEMLHDHPWDNISWVLSGGCLEEVPDPHGPHRLAYERKAGDIVYRKLTDRHRLLLTEEAHYPMISLFIMFKWKQTWGFYDAAGKKTSYKDYFTKKEML